MAGVSPEGPGDQGGAWFGTNFEERNGNSTYTTMNIDEPQPSTTTISLTSDQLVPSRPLKGRFQRGRHSKLQTRAGPTNHSWGDRRTDPVESPPKLIPQSCHVRPNPSQPTTRPPNVDKARISVSSFESGFDSLYLRCLQYHQSNNWWHGIVPPK